MRCSSVDEWKTRRGPWEGVGSLRQRADVAEVLGNDDDVVLRKQETKRTYATSYDVAFIFEQLWKKKTIDDLGNRVQQVSYSKSCPMFSLSRFYSLDSTFVCRTRFKGTLPWPVDDL